MKLYHFTDTRNLASIKRYGLLSWYRLTLRKIPHIPASNELSRELDDRKRLNNYVRVCLQDWHPMAIKAQSQNRVENLAWLMIDDSVLRWRNTLYSNKNATSNDAVINNDKNTALKSDNPQAEILISNALAIKWITFP